MTAVFSPCGLYRYRLDRDLPPALLNPAGRVLFCGLNPSKAGRVVTGREVTDPTATRMAGFTEAWGYARFTIGNAFARIATDPRELVGLSEMDAVGPDNDTHLAGAAAGADLIVACWGASYPPQLAGRIPVVLALLAADGPLHHLGVTKNGDPRHPLFLLGTTTPTRWAIP